METTAPSFRHLKSSSVRASKALKGSSRKKDTRCEVLLRSALWKMGLRFRKNVASLPGKPDIVFPKARVVVFCDGDFWHGKNWRFRRQKLVQGSNSAYWISKIHSNKARDTARRRCLQEAGWTVVRLWESEIIADPHHTATRVRSLVQAMSDSASEFERDVAGTT